MSTPCQCGCGTPVARRYAPGHDARHKSALKAALVEGDWREAHRAAEALADLGWGHFAEAADLRAVPYRTRQGWAKQLTSEVTRWQVDHLGGHHSNRRCRTLTSRAREFGGINPVTRLAADRYVVFAEAGPEVTERLQSSWDFCPECTVDHTREVDAEHYRIGAVEHLTLDPGYEPVRRNRTPKHEWQVELDDGTGRLVRVTRNPVTGALTHHHPEPVNPWAAPLPEERVA